MRKFQSDLLSVFPAETFDDLSLQFQSTLSSVLEINSPLMSIKVFQRPFQPWFSCEIAEAETKRRRLKHRWRQTKLEADWLSLIEVRNNVCKLISAARTLFYSSRNQKALLREMNHLPNRQTVTPIPPHESPWVLANQFADYFSRKIDVIRCELNYCVPLSLHAPGTDSQIETNFVTFSTFGNVTIKTVSDLNSSCGAKTYDLDPVPTIVTKDCSELLAPTMHNKYDQHVYLYWNYA